MMNIHHAVSGLLAATAIAPLLGMTTVLEIAPFAIALAGWATAPDLDCTGSSPSRVFGPLGHTLSTLIRTYSAWLYRHTRGPKDPHSSAGTHRHATHTPIHCVIAGLLAVATTAPGGEFGSVAATVWLLLGVALAAMVLGYKALIAFAAAAVGWFSGVTIHNLDIIRIIAAHSSWIGLAVGVGCLVHTLGDDITHGGTPVVFPWMVDGARWRCYGIPKCLRFTAGGTFERVVVGPALIVATVLLVPGVWPHFVDLVTAVRHGVLRT